MFSGIVERLGTVHSLRPRAGGARLVVRAPGLRPGLGESIAVDGACLTAIAPRPGELTAELSPETLARTTLGKLRPAAQVNLEPSLRLGDRLGGHFVLGHVDATGTVTALARSGGGFRLAVRYPLRYDPLVVEKGSVAVNGVSLTVAGSSRGELEVALIPHTLDVTNLGRLRAGGLVNLEFDYLAKLVAKLTASLQAPPRRRSSRSRSG